MYANDLRWIDKAVKVAATSEHPKWRHGCVIVRHNHASTGVNKLRSDPRNEEYVPTFHAEETALRQAYNGGRGSICYIARVSKRGRLLLARPCDNCWRMLKDAGVKRVVYTVMDGVKEEKI